MNSQVTWQDTDLANAFIEFGKQQGVSISTETAMELANNIRSQVKQNDVLEVTSLIKDEISKLFPDQSEVALASSIGDVLGVAMRRMAEYQNKMAKMVLSQSGPISSEEEEELRGGILNDVIIPMQEGVSDKIADATREYMRRMLPLKEELNAIDAFLEDEETANKLYDDMKANPNDRVKAKAYRAAQSIRDSKIRKGLEILHKINVLRSSLILLDSTNTYIKKNLSIIDQYRGVDGMSRFFEKIFQPTVQNIKDVMGRVKRGVVLPEVDPHGRHSKEWILRHHHTKEYQQGSIPPNKDSIDFEEFKGSPVYGTLRGDGVSDQTIENSLDNLNSMPTTWRKGHAIYMLMDPPAEKTVHQDIPTMLTDVPDKWDEQVITNQPFNIEKGKFDETTDLVKGTKPKAMTKDRKMSEAANEKAHWSVLMNLSRNQRIDRSGKTRAEKYVESVPEEMRDNEEVKRRAEEMDSEDMLHDEDVIFATLNNPSTPDWVLMKASVVGYATNVRRLAKAILKQRRGWQPKLDEAGNFVKDSETRDFVWERIPGFQARASVVIAQSADQSNMARQGFQDQINSVDEQIKTQTAQIEQLRMRKQDLEKQRDSVKQPAAQQPTLGAPPAPAPAPSGSPGMAPGMAMSYRTTIKTASDDEFEDSNGSEPEEGDFVYDDASSGLSVVGIKFLGKIIEWDDVVKAINEYANANNWFPSFWRISDHGNSHLIKDFKYNAS